MNQSREEFHAKFTVSRIMCKVQGACPVSKGSCAGHLDRGNAIAMQFCLRSGTSRLIRSAQRCSQTRRARQSGRAEFAVDSAALSSSYAKWRKLANSEKTNGEKTNISRFQIKLWRSVSIAPTSDGVTMVRTNAAVPRIR